MSADPLAVQNLFARAVAIADPNQRQAFVREQCADDAELLRRVEDLLAAYDEPKPFFDQPTAQLGNLPASAPLQPIEAAQRPGSVVAGRYKLLEAIGEGGMGTVWVAEQTSPVRRKVALKLVKPGMDSRQVLARFDAERQALALMDHPNIAKVFDGGVTEQGRPFFAMEYVKGMPLTEYCDQVRLSLEERIKLFVPICQAVQHAHQKGIIHRDLKPSNVLICLYDGKPVPKVIDFGLAKAMYQPLTEHTLHTGHGLMLGTPLYMSPEQAEHNNLDVDTRSDIYSLGVMLYELLTGTTPLERAQFKEAAFGEILRLIKEVEPPKPSTRVSTNAQRASIAAQRSLEPEQLGRSIRGDLDWIVMKALDKERDRRYETANGLARDLERFLNQEAVEACPPSTVYRLKKQFQKHRAAISTAAAFLLLVCAGAVVSTWQAYRATKAEQIAVTAEATAREQRDKAIENERQALAAKTAEADARLNEERARLAETQQRAKAESQRIEAVKQRDEAQRLQQEAVARSTQLQQLTEEQRRAIYASDMNLVRIEAQRGNLTRLRELLYAQLPTDHPDLRGMEWNYWYRYLTQAKVLRRFADFRGDNQASQPVINPGARFLALPQGTNTALVDLQTGKVLQTIPQTIGKLVNRARFSAHGRSVFGEYDSQRAFGGNVQASDGTMIQGGLRRDGFTVYEPGQEARHFTYPDDTFSHISYLNISEDGRYVGALGNDVSHRGDEPVCRLMIWDIEIKELVLNHLEQRRLNRFSFSRDGSRVAAYYCHGPVSLSSEPRDVVVALDVAEQKVLGVARYTDDIDSVTWMPDAQRLLLTTLGFSGNHRKELLSWNLDSAEPQRLSSELMPSYVLSDVSPNGELIAIGGSSTSHVHLIDTESGAVNRTLHYEATEIESLAFSQDGTQLTAFGSSGDLVQWSITQDDDRFALRSRPLSPPSFLGQVQWEVSAQHDRIAYQTYAEFLSVRDADGTELFTRDEKRTKFQTTPQILRFSMDGRLLAVVTVIENQVSTVELIDLQLGSVRWTAKVDLVRDLVFTDDASALIVASISHIQRLDIQSGQAQTLLLGNGHSRSRTADGPIQKGSTEIAQPLADIEPNAQEGFSTLKLARVGLDRRLVAVGISLDSARNKTEIQIRDVSSGERLQFVASEAINQSVGRGVAVDLLPGPDGTRLVRAQAGIIEIWDLALQQLVLTTSGTRAFFSQNGEHVVILRSTDSAGADAKVPRSLFGRSDGHPIDSALIVSAENGRTITSLSFGGDTADDVRLSSDGHRLLSLHGKLPDTTKSRPSHARLWDCLSGREILDLAVSPDNRFYWDLDFTPDGQSLSGFVLTKARGTGIPGRSLLFDATPLPPHEDASLVATNWIRRLETRTPVPQQILKIIHDNQSCQPRVREVALELAGKIPFDGPQIVERCLAIVERPDEERSNYQQALSWAEALEPGSLRTIALVGAAQYRLGLIAEALQTVRLTGGKLAANESDSLIWEQRRRAIEVLCLHQQGQDSMTTHRQAIALADFVHDLAGTSASTINWSPLAIEALRSQSEQFRVKQMNARPQPTMLAEKTSSTNPNQQASLSDRARPDLFFTRLDVNRDGVVSEEEVGGAERWERFSRFDRDQIAGLSLTEYTAGLLINRADYEADKLIPASTKQAFDRFDRNQDGRATAVELGDAWAIFRQWDQDHDDALSLPEFQRYQRQNAFVLSLMRSILGSQRPEHPVQLLTLNIALEAYPGDMTLLNGRAWLQATSDDEAIRNGQQAVLDALAACELCDYRVPTIVDTLAAAYAEVGEFDKAIHHAEQAASMSGEIELAQKIKLRLQLFKQNKPFRQSLESTIEPSQSSTSLRPLFSSEQLATARRIRGGEPCWSADGQQLLYALTGFAPEYSYFESLDLATGQTKILCAAGQRPVRSPFDGTIAFERSLSEDSPQVWLFDPRSNESRKLVDGMVPHWTRDGSLCYVSLLRPGTQLLCIDPEKPDKPIWSQTGIFSTHLWALSPDNQSIARSSFGKWSVLSLEAAEQRSISHVSNVDKGRADWSPDGRLIAYGARNDSTDGVWLLDVETMETRLLANIYAHPRWSPDGKTLALGLQSSNEILLLDVSSLDSLWKENPAPEPEQP